MGAEKSFQICYEGDLTVEVCAALRRLGAEPNFEQSWQVRLPEERHAAPLVRYLQMLIGGDARLLVARTHLSRSRDFLLVRHSLTLEADYRELHGALERIGEVLEMPFESTYIVASDDTTDVQTLGAALAELCPDDSLMVTGISHDFAFCTTGLRWMFVAQESVYRGEPFRAF